MSAFAPQRRLSAWLWPLGSLCAAAGMGAWAASQLPAWLARLAVHGVEIARPAWLPWTLLAFLVPALLPWRLTDLSRWQTALQAGVRMALVALAAVALSGPRRLQEAPRPPQVIHLIDRSESAPEALLQAASQGVQATAQVLAALAPSPGADQPKLEVIAFDRRAVRLPASVTQLAAESSGRAGFSLPRDPSTAQATDLHGALQLALGLVDGHSVPHLVIWSDGLETHGDALQSLPALRAAGVRVHTPLLPALPPAAEVVVERLQLPEKVRAGVNFPLAVVVASSAPAQLECELQAPGQAPRRVQVGLKAGENQLALGELRLRQPGPAELSVTCKLLQGGDRFASNNQLRGRVIVQERPKLLYVEGGGVRQALALLSALQDDFEVEVRPGDGLPRSLAGLLPYQAVLLSDVPRVSNLGVPLLTDGDMRNLDSYVRQGGGLWVIGGENSLGSGGYQETYLDKHTLPVRMDVESSVDQPLVALMLVVDRSGSMTGSKMELAKAAAAATAKALAPHDQIGVVAFDTEPRLAVRLQRAGNSYRIESDIAKIFPSGGTHILPALDLAYQQLVAAQAKIKHVIVMTDGQAPRQGIDALVRQMRRSGVTVSSVGVGSDVDRSLLEAIADRGGGRSYFTDRPETLPRIFVRETKLIAGQSVVEQSVRARRAPNLGRIDLLRGVELEAAPALGGFLPTRVKPGAEEILRLSNGKPLLVRWRLGQGKVAVWTSDLKNRWAHAWIDWPSYARLARQIARDVLQEELGLEVQVRLERQADRLRVAVDAIDEAGEWLSGLRGAADLVRPDGSKVVLALSEVAAGRYEADQPLDQLGAYDVHVKLSPKTADKVLASGRATLVHPYPDEHRLAEGASPLLPALVQATQGKADSAPADWIATAGATQRSWQPLWPELLRAALLLLLIDVLLRRVRLGRAPLTRWHGLKNLR